MRMELKDWKKIHEYCMNKPCVYETRPFGVDPICYRVSGKIFAQLTPKENWFKITVKTNPNAADFYRHMYLGVVVRGYHCPPVQQPYWNTIELEQFEEDVLWQMLDEAYAEVIKKLPKRERERLPLMEQYQFVKTNGADKVFGKLCEHLNQELEELIGKKKQNEQYDQYNTLEAINDVVLVYEGEKAIGCAAYKPFDEETAELKRVFVDKDYRGKGIAKELLRRIEADARISGYRFMALETGTLLQDARELYTRSGYKLIPNFEPYVNMPQSICMRKKI